MLYGMHNAGQIVYGRQRHIHFIVQGQFSRAAHDQMGFNAAFTQQLQSADAINNARGATDANNDALLHNLGSGTG